MPCMHEIGTHGAGQQAGGRAGCVRQAAICGMPAMAAVAALPRPISSKPLIFHCCRAEGWPPHTSPARHRMSIRQTSHRKSR